jgi:hypothetical protein
MHLIIRTGCGSDRRDRRRGDRRNGGRRVGPRFDGAGPDHLVPLAGFQRTRHRRRLASAIRDPPPPSEIIESVVALFVLSAHLVQSSNPEAGNLQHLREMTLHSR